MRRTSKFCLSTCCRVNQLFIINFTKVMTIKEHQYDHTLWEGHWSAHRVTWSCYPGQGCSQLFRFNQTFLGSLCFELLRFSGKQLKQLSRRVCSVARAASRGCSSLRGLTQLFGLTNSESLSRKVCSVGRAALRGLLEFSPPVFYKSSLSSLSYPRDLTTCQPTYSAFTWDN